MSRALFLVLAAALAVAVCALPLIGETGCGLGSGLLVGMPGCAIPAPASLLIASRLLEAGLGVSLAVLASIAWRVLGHVRLSRALARRARPSTIAGHCVQLAHDIEGVYVAGL